MRDNTRALLQLLSNGNEISGAKLGEALAISRTAVWKKIKQLKAVGIDITSETAKGYRLSQPLHLLELQQIEQAIADPELCRQIKWQLHFSLPSTNDYLKNLYTQANNFRGKSMRVCLAEQQTAGKGRLGRMWYSPFGANIYCSILWQLSKDASELAGFSLIVGLAVIEALKAYGLSLPLQLKWPNDVMCDNKKIAGILIEVLGVPNQNTQLVIGVGLNVNMRAKTKVPIQQSWTSLAEITNTWHNRNQIAGLLVKYISSMVHTFLQKGFTPFLPLWEQHDYLRGKSITLQQLNQNYTGKVLGIDHAGNLLLEQADGQVQPFAIGEATLCKK